MVNLPSTELYLKRIGVTLDDVDKLNVIHVAGKGRNIIQFCCMMSFCCTVLLMSNNSVCY